MAKKNNGKAAKRAAKKHEKEVKRKRALAERTRTTTTEPGRPDHAWRPAREGIEGLALRMGITTHSASQLAEHLYQHHGRKDAAAAWLPSRVSAMDVAAVVNALAERGIVAEETGFRALAAELLSARALAEATWFPKLAALHDVHDRDFCGQAAEQLWLEWCPDVYSDERLDGDLNAVDIALDEEEPQVGASLLVQVWRDLGDGAASRLAAADMLLRFFELSADIFDLHTENGSVDAESRLALADALRLLRAEASLDPEQAYHTGALADDFDWSLGRGEELLSRMLLTATDAADPVLAMDAAAMVLDQDDATTDQFVRVRDLLAELLPALSGHLAEDVEAYIADLQARGEQEPELSVNRSQPRPIRKGGSR